MGEKQLINKQNVVTCTIIIINIIVYIYTAMKAGNIFDIDANTLVDCGGQLGVYIDYKDEWWRLFTCMFLHGGAMHLILNMAGLYFLGSQSEVIFGKIKYIIIYIFSGLISSYVSYLFSDPRTVSIGASGAIFGVMAAILIFSFLNKSRINKDAVLSLAVIMGANLFMGFRSDGTDNFGHIGGIIGGLILGYLCTLILKRQHKNNW